MEFDMLVNAAPLLTKALGQTLLFSLISMCIAFVLGFLLAEVSILGGRVTAFVTRCLIEGVRGVPLLVFVFLTYYSLPKLGIRLDAMYSGCIALAVFFSMYVAEIFRGAFRTIPKVQTEAGMALGMSHWKIQIIVLLPQALRIALPSLMNIAAIVIKATSVMSIIGVWELTLATNELVMRTLAPFTFFVAALVLYFVLCYSMVRSATYLSNRLNKSQRF
ncbi:amino acid ABC transporter permease [Verminephrobacter eiseniae]|uniref:amino acid ABC transporter permease n=1 Tax=Verminephrobacter eiseniae TaxID=364317 RepID=UPI002237AB79|nr:amino acid ABC transporter permease [Verminephrobacter eiseniae]MCW5259618.1 amino acid ABC transporter permease [Verminephrobacter eiseniae]